MINFIEKQIYPLNFRSEFSRLVINVSKESLSKEFWQTKDPAIAYVNITIDLENFTASNSQKLSAFEKVLKLGVDVALRHTKLPKAEIMTAIESFKACGFENKWVHFDKTWKRKGLRCVLECNHEMESFTLVQKLYKDDAIIVEKVIAESLPRELLYQQLLGKVVLKENTRLVYSAKGMELSAYDIESGELEILDNNKGEELAVSS